MPSVRILLIVLLIGALSCSGERRAVERETTIPAETFVRVLSDLVAARVEALPDTADYHDRRAEILQAAGITGSDLRRFVEIRGGNADLMAAVYRIAAARLDSLAARQTRSPGPATPTRS